MAICNDESSGEESESYEQIDAAKQRGGYGQEQVREIKVTRQAFETRLRGRTFDSWEDFLDSAAEGPVGWARVPASQPGGSVVKLDPMQVFAWVATLMIEIALWGLVAWSAVQNLALGIAVSALYGVVLYVAASREFSKNLAGMIWPNVPCAVAAVGALFGLLAQGDSNDVKLSEATGWMFFCSILPQTVAAGFWMRKLPEDPDRASLVSNVFLGIWASVEAAYVMGQPDDEVWDSFWAAVNTWYYFSWWSLLVISVATVGLAWHLFTVPGRLSSEEMISWTLNVGILGFFVSAGFLLSIPQTQNFAEWLAYLLVAIAIGFIARRFGRSFPWLLSAVGFSMVAIRGCTEVATQTGQPLLGFLAFGVVGIGVAVATQFLLGSNQSVAEPLNRQRRRSSQGGGRQGV